MIAYKKKHQVNFGIRVLFDFISLRLTCIILLSLANSVSFASEETIQFKHFGVGQGLPNSVINRIYQDARGYLWIGTADGLCRYDGYNFQVYRNDPENEASISNNEITAIYEDSFGNIWIGTNNGLNKFDWKTGKFKRYLRNYNDKKSISSDSITAICDDIKGVLWVGTNAAGLNKLGKDGNSFIRISNNSNGLNSPNKKPCDNRVRVIIRDHKGILWIGTRDGSLNKFDSKTNEFTCYDDVVGDKVTMYNNGIRSLCEDSSGNIWIGTFDVGIKKFDPVALKFKRFVHDPKDPKSLTSNIINQMLVDQRGNLWVATFGGGLDRLQMSEMRFEHNVSNPKVLNSLSNDNVISLCEDRSGVIWVGTSVGLDKCLPNFFQNFLRDPSNPKSLSSNYVMHIKENPSGNLWISTFGGGLNFFNKATEEFDHFIYRSNDPISISSNYVSFVNEDRLGQIWIGTFGGGLNKFNTKSRKFEHYGFDSLNKKSISSNNICAFYQDKAGMLWIGSGDGGLNKFNPETGESIHFFHDPDNPNSLPSNVIWGFEADSSNHSEEILWIATDNGFARFDVKHEIFKQFFIDTHGSGKYNKVVQILKDHNGILWLATAYGLWSFESKRGVYKHYTTKDGLANNIIWCMQEDDQGRLWIGTSNGLSCFNAKTEQFRNFDSNDGLPGNEFNYWSHCKLKNGELCFGTTNGFTIFNPENLKENSHIPSIEIIGFSKLNTPIDIHRVINQTGNIELTYQENIFSLEFAAMDFIHPEKNQYAYKLEGFDKEWVYCGTRRSATYTNLDHGSYIFRVKGSNNDGVWNNQGASIQIMILPPWWKTWWAYISYALVFIFSLYGIRRYEMNRLRLKDKVKMDEAVLREREETDKMKSRFFANISHEFRTPLTLMLGPADKIISETSDDIKKDANIIKRNSRRLLQLINQLLDLSRLEAGKLKLQASKGNIVSFVKGVALSFESLSESKDITLELLAEKEYIEMYFDRDKMMKVLSNIIYNAFKFTPDEGKITISIKETENRYVEITIRDSGIGIAREEIPKLFDRFYQVDSSLTREYEGTGIGLALTKELVELHWGKISVESEKANNEKDKTSWTEFKLEFLLGREHLQEDEIVNQEGTVSESKINTGDNPFTENTNQIIDKNSVINETTWNEDKAIILVVEDNYDMRTYIKESFSSDYIVEEAVNGEQGLRKAEKIIPDLIISDMMMPKMDGNELVRNLKSNEKTSHIPVILLTAKAGLENKLEGLETGADDYLTKPFEIKELLVRVKNLISIRKKLQEKFSKVEYILNPQGKKLASMDEQFMNKVLKIIGEHISEESFSTEELGNEVGMSRAQFYRKIKAVTGLPASIYLRTVRLTRAKKMIEEKQGTISEIAYSVGFSSPSYFAKCFKEQFGYPPRDSFQ